VIAALYVETNGVYYGLEHPARSQAWRAFALPYPMRGWANGLGDPGWAIEVDQHAYGFPTRKNTWLYCVGTDLGPIEQYRAPYGTPGCDALWSTERARTPLAFRDALLAMARSASPALAAGGQQR
jgi:hypothetical protein